MRSVLTMLGISWGVVSLVLLLAFGEGLGGGIMQAVGNMGNNVIVIWPGQTSMQAGGQRAGRKIHYEYEDIQAIRAEVPIIRAVSAESVTDFGFKDGTRVVSIQTRGVEYPLRCHAQDLGCGGPQHRGRRVRQPQAGGRAGTRSREAHLSGRSRRGPDGPGQGPQLRSRRRHGHQDPGLHVRRSRQRAGLHSLRSFQRADQRQRPADDRLPADLRRAAQRRLCWLRAT